MSQRVQKRLKIDPKYFQNGVLGGSEAPWGPDPISARIWHVPWPPFCAQMSPRDAKVTPKWKQMGSKGSQISFKNLCENHHSFSYPFLYQCSHCEFSATKQEIVKRARHKGVITSFRWFKCCLRFFSWLLGHEIYLKKKNTVVTSWATQKMAIFFTKF